MISARRYTALVSRLSLCFPVILVLWAFVAASAGCDSTAKFHIKTIKFDRIQMLSSFPAERSGDGYRRVCSGPADAIEINLSFISTARETSGTETAPDLDRSIRPGDRVDRNEVTVGDANASVSKELLDLSIDCIEPYPDEDLLTGQQCQGIKSPPSDVLTLMYEAITAKRGEAVAVALLIDQSGSMNGLVDQDDKQEDELDLITPAPNREPFSSDSSSERIAQAVRFIRTLNADDKLVVYTFNGKEGVDVACTLQAEDERQRAELCFGTRRDIFTDKLDTIGGFAKGRTNLWQAVNEAWDFLKDEAPSMAKHIVVVSDGPDTCSPSEVYRRSIPVRPVCASTGFDDVKQLVHNEWDRHKIRISFVQFQAPGYRDHDARQWEIACMSEGQYLFINSAQLPTAKADLGSALSEAVLKLRYALSGVWKGYVSLPAYSTDAPFASGGVPVGKVYALQGSLRLGKSIFTKVSETQSFGIGGSKSSGLNKLANLDERLPLRKPCAEEDQCGARTGECSDACNDQTAVCGDFPAPDGAQCGGGQGICCAGKCETGAACP